MKRLHSPTSVTVLERRAGTFTRRACEAMERNQAAGVAGDTATAAAWRKVACGYYEARAIMVDTANRRRMKCTG